MGDFYEQFFATENEPPEPPAGLERKIMRRVAAAKRRALVVKILGFSSLFAGSVCALVVGYFNLMSALAQSGFFDFASLFFSDFGAAAANFQDFAFSMLESFPVFSAAFLLGGIILAIWSAAHVMDDITEIRMYRNLAMPR